MKNYFTFCAFFIFILNIKSQTFTTSGSYTVPAGVKSIIVEAWGAGGAGGSASGTGSPTLYRAQAGGGGGGAFVSGTINVTPGQVINYIVASSTGANTTTGIIDGGASSFGGITAPGGSGGQSVDAGTSGGNVGGAGGAGGAGTFSGGNGATRTGYSGSTTAGTSAGGGGGAGTSANGGDANSSTNAGGGGGSLGGGNGANGPSNGNAGGGGLNIGGGGAGAWAAASTTFRNGGAGARGEIRITTILPVNFSSFEVTSTQSKEAVCKWTTASELDNAYFQIQRSSDALAFADVAIVEGVGTTNESNSYEYTDKNANAGLNYYRIKQVDIDGKSSYSEIKSAWIGDKEDITLVASIVKDRLSFNANIDAFKVGVYSVTGQQVIANSTLSKSESIDVTTLPAGQYVVSVSTGSTTKALKFIKQ